MAEGKVLFHWKNNTDISFCAVLRLADVLCEDFHANAAKVMWPQSHCLVCVCYQSARLDEVRAAWPLPRHQLTCQHWESLVQFCGPFCLWCQCVVLTPPNQTLPPSPSVEERGPVHLQPDVRELEKDAHWEPPLLLLPGSSLLHSQRPPRGHRQPVSGGSAVSTLGGIHPLLGDGSYQLVYNELISWDFFFLRA